MLLNWVDNSSFKREEQFMHVLYDCGLATFDQLVVITGWTPRNLRLQISRLYKRNRNEDGEIWLVAHYTSRARKKSPMVYGLGRAAMQYVHDMRHEDRKVRDTPLGQARHFIGINDVLVRALQILDRGSITWLPSYEATDRLILNINNKKDETFNRRNMIRPDAKLTIKGAAYYIEFDNDTENPRQLEKKFHSYVQTLSAINDLVSPILWITTNAKRKSYLQRNWEATKRISYPGQNLPKMYFFEEGEELSLYG